MHNYLWKKNDSFEWVKGCLSQLIARRAFASFSFKIRFIIILCKTGPPGWIFPSYFWNKILQGIFNCCIHATHSAHLIFCFFSLIIFGDEYKL